MEIPSKYSLDHSVERAEGQTASGEEVSEASVDDVDDLAANPRYHVYKFHSEILPDDRAVLVYLPQQYLEQEERRFPVFYLQDGQNLFDGRTSYIAGRTWNAHTTADRLTRESQIEPLILVGIANTGLRRMAEYTPTRDFRLGGGEGPSYGRLLIEELKPFIDRAYRTLTGPEDTGLGGSSLGGLISLYLGFERPDVFTIVNKTEPKPKLRIWLDVGVAEGARHVRDAELLNRLLLDRGWQSGVDLTYLKAEGAVHDEDAWSARLDQVLRFLFPSR